MSPKQSSLKHTVKKRTPPPPRPAPLTPTRSRPNLVELAKKSLALREQHAAKKDGFGRPLGEKPTPAAATRYLIQFDDGTILHAEGAHAAVIYRFISECEQICHVQGLAYYGGPGMHKITLDQLRALLAP